MPDMHHSTTSPATGPERTRRPPAPPPHPGASLRVALERLGVKQEAAAESLGVTRVHRNRVLNGRCAVSPAMALRLSRALGTSAGMWLALQRARDLWDARERDAIALSTIAVMPEAARVLSGPALVELP